ncbi:putative LRR receptor-like serine/threonine-protein kinase [Raphanus sativus]|nr:putative LRR receptor-like serine/threonine-protein kinase [Raphanus sativus]
MTQKILERYLRDTNVSLTYSFGVVAMEIVDSKEAVRMIKVALACTISSPSLRPTMSEAVQMLEGDIEVTQVMSDHGIYGHNWSILKLRDADTQGSSSTSGVTDQTASTMKSSVSSSDLYPLYPESVILNSTVELASSSVSYQKMCTSPCLFWSVKLSYS